MLVIDNRLINPDTNMDATENFNRMMAILDTLSEVVADIEDSQLFKVAFDSDGGSSVDTQYVIEGDKAVEPDNPTKTAYTFSKWMKGNTEYNFNTAVKSHINLKATWTPIEYTISYTLDGGEVATANPVSYTADTDTFTLNNPTKEGYTFAGWTGSNGDVAQTEVTITKGSYGNKTYTANWTETSLSEGE